MNECQRPIQGATTPVCDAPPYPVVRAARQAGIADPEDVLWRRTSVNFLSLRSNLLCSCSTCTRSRCGCGSCLALGQRVRFEFAGGSYRIIVLSQCGRCRTVYWAVEA